MKAIYTLVVAMLVILAPAMAFVPTIPTNVEKIGNTVAGDDGQVTVDTGAYTYQRVASTANGNFQPQAAYSGMLFGASQEGGAAGETEINAGDNHVTVTGTPADYTAGVVANTIKTDASNSASTSGQPYGVTKQFIDQEGAVSIVTQPASVYNNEVTFEPTPVVTATISKSNLAWISGDLTSFTATPQSFAVVGGNYLDVAQNGADSNGVTSCGNLWFDENEVAAPITVSAATGSTLMDAYAGTESTGTLNAYPGYGTAGSSSFNKDPEVLMSGYAERFAGYDGADVAMNPVGSNTGGITIDFGAAGTNSPDATVTQSWNDQAGIVGSYGNAGFTNLDFPTNADFSQNTNLLNRPVTWPQIGINIPA